MFVTPSWDSAIYNRMSRGIGIRPVLVGLAAWKRNGLAHPRIALSSMNIAIINSIIIWLTLYISVDLYHDDDDLEWVIYGVWFMIVSFWNAQEIGKLGPSASQICCALLPTAGLCCPSGAHGRRATFVERVAQLFDDERKSLSEGLLEKIVVLPSGNLT